MMKYIIILFYSLILSTAYANKGNILNSVNATTKTTTSLCKFLNDDSYYHIATIELKKRNVTPSECRKLLEKKVTKVIKKVYRPSPPPTVIYADPVIYTDPWMMPPPVVVAPLFFDMW